MNENQVEVNGEIYDILFILHEKGDEYLMLLTDGEETFCAACTMKDQKTTFHTATEAQIEKCVSAFNEALNNVIVYNGENFDIVSKVSGITLAAKEGKPGILYPFDNAQEGYKPLHLDAAGKLYYANMYRGHLENNHDFLMEATPCMCSLSQLNEENKITSIDGYDVYLYIPNQKENHLIFVEQDPRKVCVSASKQNELLEKFRKWEEEEYKKQSDFKLENLEQE